MPYLNGLTLNAASTTPAKVGTVYAVTTVGTNGQMNGTCQAIVTATAAPGRYVIQAR